MARNIVGSVPEPDELYGRTEFIDVLWRQMEANNILLLAPRRFGKTGVMNHILRCPRPGWLPIYLDVEDVDSAREFVYRLMGAVLAQDSLRRLLQKAKGLPAFLGSWVKDTFDEAEFEGAKVKFKQSIPEEWQTAGRRLVAELEKADPMLVFILDELPSMLERMCRTGEQEAQDFLAWFRTVRLLRKDTLRRHRFVVGGSTGIDIMLRRLEVPAAMNDFERLYVEPLTEAEAVRLITDLGQTLDVELDEAVIGRILSLVGPPVPYFIHMFFWELGQLPGDRRRPVSAATAEEVYRSRLLGPTCKHYFDHYRSRLSRYGKNRERCALAVLRALVESGRASDSTLYDVYTKCRKRGASDTEFAELMAELECDWYIVLDPRTNEYGFLMNVMRDWWRRWYGAPGARRAPGRES